MCPQQVPLHLVRAQRLQLGQQLAHLLAQCGLNLAAAAVFMEQQLGRSNQQAFFCGAQQKEAAQGGGHCGCLQKVALLINYVEMPKLVKMPMLKFRP
jgi:hypothetical protein